MLNGFLQRNQTKKGCPCKSFMEFDACKSTKCLFIEFHFAGSERLTMDSFQNIEWAKTVFALDKGFIIVRRVVAYGCDDAETCDKHTAAHTCGLFFAM